MDEQKQNVDFVNIYEDSAVFYGEGARAGAVVSPEVLSTATLMRHRAEGSVFTIRQMTKSEVRAGKAHKSRLKELDSWKENEVYVRVVNKKPTVSIEWVDVWKSDPVEKLGEQSKSRLVARGFQDEQLNTFRKDV